MIYVWQSDDGSTFSLVLPRAAVVVVGTALLLAPLETPSTTKQLFSFEIQTLNNNLFLIARVVFLRLRRLIFSEALAKDDLCSSRKFFFYSNVAVPVAGDLGIVETEHREINLLIHHCPVLEYKLTVVSVLVATCFSLICSETRICIFITPNKLFKYFYLQLLRLIFFPTPNFHPQSHAEWANKLLTHAN